jgi:hypothetical protein
MRDMKGEFRFCPAGANRNWWAACYINAFELTRVLVLVMAGTDLDRSIEGPLPMAAI